MRKFSMLLPLAGMLGFASPRVSAQGGYSELRLIYVDHSREENGEGYAPSAQQYIRSTVGQIVADNTTNMLFYFSEGDQPQYTRTQEKVMGLLARLDDKPGPRPDMLAEKRMLRNALYKGRLDLVQKITVDLFVTDHTVQQGLSGNLSGLVLNFLPRELQFMSKCAPSNILVRVHYPNKFGGETKERLQQQVAFANEADPANSAIRYEFLPMSL